MAEPLRLLVVCLGNICRSPMAEGALRARLAEAGLAPRVIVDSVGTGGWHVGDPPDPRAVATAQGHGVDISGLRGRRLADADFVACDHLLCADHDNLRDVLARAPADARGKVALFMAWAGMEGAIADPYTGDARDFERVWQQVDAASQRIAQRLRTAPRAG